MSILIIILFGFVLRLISINQSLWLDEATSALVAKMPLGDIFTKFLPGDFHPPLYYLILKYWVLIFGSSEVALRIPSVIFGIGTIYITYLITRKLINKNTALIASLFLSTSCLAVYYSQEVRMYSMATFLVAFAVYLFLENRYIYFAIILVLIGLTDYVALFMLPIFWYLGFKRKKFLFAFLPLVGAYLIWSPIFFRQLSSGFSARGSLPAWWGILGAVTFKNIALFPIKFILGRVSFDNNLVYGHIFIPVFAFFVYILFKARASQKIFWLWLITPVTIGILVGFKIPTLSYFRFIFSLPALYILLAYGIEKSGRFKKLFFVLVVLINLSSSFYYLLDTKFHREDWRNASRIIGQDLVILPSNSQKEALVYYGKNSQLIYFKNFNGGKPTIWLSRYVWEIFDSNDEARRKIENLGYNKVLEANFNGVVMYKYAYRN